ncbi:MAG: hypothetical protein ABI629_25505 [bacterium]
MRPEAVRFELLPLRDSDRDELADVDADRHADTNRHGQRRAATPLGWRNLVGFVFDARQGDTAHIAGASVEYRYVDPVDEQAGTRTTNGAGRFTLRLYLRRGGTLSLVVRAPQLPPRRLTFTAPAIAAMINPIPIGLRNISATATPSKTPFPLTAVATPPRTLQITPPPR